MTQRHQMRRGEALARNVVRVDRATMWGNPFRADRPEPAALEAGAQTAAQAFKLWLDGHPLLAEIEAVRRAAILDRMGLLHGKDLACWCPPEAECHADILLERARKAEPTLGDALGRPDDVPRMALSVRQPWAWALVNGGKDVENRSEASVRNGGMRAQIGKRIAIHAAKGMTREEYEDAAESIAYITGRPCPPAAELLRGGIIGSAFLASIVNEHNSRWFCGPRGLCLTRPQPVPFIGATGELGIFPWSPNFAQPDQPARWMLPAAPRVKQATEKQAVAPVSEPDLFKRMEG